jgi:2-oxoisovalerate dehydrogenase E1 component alpha subunit
VLEEVRAAGREAEKVGVLGASRPPLEEMFKDVYKEQPWHLREQMREVLESEAEDGPPAAKKAKRA